MHNNTNNSDRMNTVAYKIGQVIALVACLCVSAIVRHLLSQVSLNVFAPISI